jgi:hypothetical protein
MVIGITINNIIRNYIDQLKKHYQEVTGIAVEEDVNPYDLEKYFPSIASEEFISQFDPNSDGETEFVKNEVNNSFNVYDFIYNEAAFEIFGRADEAIPNIIRNLNDYEKKLDVKIYLLSKESPRSKCATLFFLSKNGFNLDKVIFPKYYKDFWNDVDVLISDDDRILDKRAPRKWGIKVENKFNFDPDYTYTIKNISDTKNLRRIIKTIKNKQVWKRLKKD